MDKARQAPLGQQQQQQQQQAERWECEPSTNDLALLARVAAAGAAEDCSQGQGGLDDSSASGATGGVPILVPQARHTGGTVKTLLKRKGSLADVASLPSARQQCKRRSELPPAVAAGIAIQQQQQQQQAALVAVASQAAAQAQAAADAAVKQQQLMSTAFLPSGLLSLPIHAGVGSRGGGQAAVGAQQGGVLQEVARLARLRGGMPSGTVLQPPLPSMHAGLVMVPGLLPLWHPMAAAMQLIRAAAATVGGASKCTEDAALPSSQGKGKTEGRE